MGIFDAIIHPFKHTTEKPTLTRPRMAGPQDDFDDSSVGHPVIYSGVSAKALNLKTAPIETALHKALKDLNHTGNIIDLVNKATPEILGFQDKEGNTPLHLAIMQNKPEIALALATRMLPEDVHVKNNEGKTQIEHLLHESHENRTNKNWHALWDPVDIMIGSKSKLTAIEVSLIKSKYPVNEGYKPEAPREAPKTTNS